ncbi:hypothetical protein SAMN05428979_0904 [Stappia sp. ES.058]|nr:hypothetical protein SAMN05428979_0904 [Stappia sp. ES.058]
MVRVGRGQSGRVAPTVMPAKAGIQYLQALDGTHRVLPFMPVGPDTCSMISPSGGYWVPVFDGVETGMTSEGWVYVGMPASHVVPSRPGIKRLIDECMHKEFLIRKNIHFAISSSSRNVSAPACQSIDYLLKGNTGAAGAGRGPHDHGFTYRQPRSRGHFLPVLIKDGATMPGLVRPAYFGVFKKRQALFLDFLGGRVSDPYSRYAASVRYERVQQPYPGIPHDVAFHLNGEWQPRDKPLCTFNLVSPCVDLKGCESQYNK